MGLQGYTQGDFGWTQLSTTSPADAISFYSDLVGWEKKGEPAPGYHVIGREGEMLGGITDLKDGDTVPHWMPYITVDDLDATLAKAVSLGGKIVMEPCDIPNDGGRIAVIKDPQGLATGLAQYKKA